MIVTCLPYCCSLEFSLLSVEEQEACWPDNAGPFISPVTSVQLQTRNWIIRDQTGEVTQYIRGDGVIGRHPILVPGMQPGHDAFVLVDQTSAIPCQMIPYLVHNPLLHQMCSKLLHCFSPYFLNLAGSDITLELRKLPSDLL